MNAPFTDLAIAGTTFKALLDTGASASMIRDEVASHLERREAKLRQRKLPLQLACGEACSNGDVRLVVRWNQWRQRQRFIHLTGLAVPVILGRDFLAKSGIVIDFGNGGYREHSLALLAHFAAPAFAEVERRNLFKESNVSRALPKPLAVACQHGFAPRLDRKRCDLLADVGDLTQHEQDRVLSLLNDFDEMFTDRPGCTKLVQHRIKTGDAQPWKSNPRPVSLAKREAIDAALQELLEAGIVRRSTSPWDSGAPSRSTEDGRTLSSPAGHSSLRAYLRRFST